MHVKEREDKIQAKVRELLKEYKNIDGIVGDMLSSFDFKTTASVLVVQQQRKRISKRELRGVVFTMVPNIWTCGHHGTQLSNRNIKLPNFCFDYQ